ncbi:MAG TPA: cation diffusion facilitator family transporter [Polyangiaceae bacterium]|nr:cation diffusion facilitator family transporter [Polyangiaceae bacterium]
MGHGNGDPKKVVIAALLGNAGIATAKFVAAFLSGSATMLAEAVHSVADTANQAFLLIGMRLSDQSSPDKYPLGRSKEAYFWAFIVSLFLFFMGGVFAVYEGVHKLTAPHEAPGSQVVPLVVLGVSLLMEGWSFSVAFKEFNKSRGGKGFRQALFDSRDPTIPVVLLEDTGAVFGLLFAFVAVGVTTVTGDPRFDGIGSIAIGSLLCVIGVALARDTRSLLIGEGITDEMRERVLQVAGAAPSVLEVRQLLSLHLGPSSVLLALKVRFKPELDLKQLELAINELENRIRGELPQMKKIFVEPDSQYDSSLDPDAART